jgi:hypothetical protein
MRDRETHTDERKRQSEREIKLEREREREIKLEREREKPKSAKPFNLHISKEIPATACKY